jgi:hypothetical protein
VNRNFKEICVCLTSQELAFLCLYGNKETNWPVALARCSALILGLAGTLFVFHFTCASLANYLALFCFLFVRFVEPFENAMDGKGVLEW